MIHELIYTSTACLGVNVDKIIEASEIRNAQHDVTGILIYNGTQFMQLLEGPEEEVTMIFEVIAADSRHNDVRIRSTTTEPERSFSRFPMKYCDELVGEIYLPETSNDVIRMTARLNFLRCHV